MAGNTYNWIGAHNASWATAGNWSPSGPPPSTEIASFIDGLTTYRGVNFANTSVAKIVAQDTNNASYWRLDNGANASSTNTWTIPSGGGEVNVTTAYPYSFGQDPNIGALGLIFNIAGAGNDLRKTGNGNIVLDLTRTKTYRDLYIEEGGLHVGGGGANTNYVLAGGNIYLSAGTHLGFYTVGGGNVTNPIYLNGDANIFFTSAGTSTRTTFNGPLYLGSNNLNVFAQSCTTDSGFFGVMSGSGTITKTGTSIFTINPASSNLFTGDTIISEGGLYIGVNSLVSSSLEWNTVNSGSFSNSANAIIGNLRGTSDITFANAIFIGNNNKDETFNGSMQGAQAVTKIGTGEWYNNNNSTYSTRTGATTISNGALRVGYDDTLGQTATGGVTVNNAGAIKFAAGTPPAKAWSIGGTATYYGGKHVIFESTAAVSSSITLTSDVIIDDSYYGISFSGAGNITAAGYNLNLIGSSTYIINKILALGAGSLVTTDSNVTLGSANTFSGFYYNDNGYTDVYSATALGSATCAQVGGVIRSYSGFYAGGGGYSGVASLTIGGMHNASMDIDLETATSITIGTTAIGNGVYAGSIRRPIYSLPTTSLTKTGTGKLSLQNSNFHVGTTTVSDGVLELTHINALGSTSGLTVAAGKTLQVAPELAGGNISIGGSVSMAGGNFIIV